MESKLFRNTQDNPYRGGGSFQREPLATGLVPGTAVEQPKGGGSGTQGEGAEEIIHRITEQRTGTPYSNELILQAMEEYASVKVKEKESTINFYREQMQKIREYIEQKKIGKPCQSFFDVMFEHLADSYTLDEIEDALKKCRKILHSGASREDFARSLKAIELSILTTLKSKKQNHEQ